MKPNPKPKPWFYKRPMKEIGVPGMSAAPCVTKTITTFNVYHYNLKKVRFGSKAIRSSTLSLFNTIIHQYIITHNWP